MHTQDATQKIQAHARGWYTRKKVGEERNRQTMAARFQHLMARHRWGHSLVPHGFPSLVVMAGFSYITLPAPYGTGERTAWYHMVSLHSCITALSTVAQLQKPSFDS